MIAKPIRELPIRKLGVRLTRGPGDELVVGHLAQVDRRVFFEYDPRFIERPLWLSPFKLPPKPGLIEHRDLDFGPIFGLFDDSLPDGWGLLLMDRFFRQRQRPLEEISPLDRLAYLGRRTMGALTYHPPSEPDADVLENLDLHQIAKAADQILRGSTEEVLPLLLRAGGSPGGARPKVLIGLRGDEIISGEDDLPAGFDHWLVKFPAREDPPDAGAVEQAFATMARNASIDLPPTRLFETAQGERFFGVERFDRAGKRRFHVHTFGNLIHANFRVPSSDYRQLLEVTRILTKKHQDVAQAFRRMVFNVLGHNRDDHVKNFAFVMSDEGEWRLSPAYDLTFSPGPGGEHSTTIAGEGRAPARRHLLAVAESVGLAKAEAEAVIEEVAEAADGWRQLALELEVDRETIDAIERTMVAGLKRVRINP